MRRIPAHVGRLFAIAALATILAALAWRATGGTLYTVRTASMGTAAPVGSLVLDRPADRLRVGEVITFRPPGSSHIFTHRIAALEPGGAIQTRGDINDAPDGWRLTRANVLGHVVATVRYAGWLLRALPILCAGFAIVWLLTRAFVAPAWRGSTEAAGLLAVAVIAVTVVKPLVGWAVISFRAGEGGAMGSVVSTGALPLRVSAAGGTSRTTGSGEVALVATTRAVAGHRYRLDVAPDWEWWWIAPLALLALAPGAMALRVAGREAAATVAPPITPPPASPPALPAPLVPPLVSPVASVAPPARASVPPPGWREPEPRPLIPLRHRRLLVRR